MTTAIVDTVKQRVTDSGEPPLCPSWMDWLLALLQGNDDYVIHTDAWEYIIWSEIPPQIRIVIQLAQALTHYNMAYALHDLGVQAELQQMMVRHLQRLTTELMTAKPEPHPWHATGFKPSPHPWDFGRRPKPDPTPWAEGRKIPRGGQLSLEIFRALALYKMASGFNDVEARDQILSVVGRQLGSLVTQLAHLPSEQI